MTRSIEALVDEQVRRWELLRKGRSDSTPRAVITVARQHGARGTDLARCVAAALDYDLFDQALIQRIAESSHLAERVVAALDERNRELLTDWLAAAASRNYLSPAEYRYHLMKVVGAIAHQGGAVIVGRGAHLILGQGGALRVLAVAPIGSRLRTVMEKERVSEGEARRRIVEVEADRRAFLAKQFHAEFSQPADFDLVVNTAALGVDVACDLVCAALARLPARNTPIALAAGAPSAWPGSLHGARGLV